MKSFLPLVLFALLQLPAIAQRTFEAEFGTSVYFFSPRPSGHSPRLLPVQREVEVNTLSIHVGTAYKLPSYWSTALTYEAYTYGLMHRFENGGRGFSVNMNAASLTIRKKIEIVATRTAIISALLEGGPAFLFTLDGNKKAGPISSYSLANRGANFYAIRYDWRNKWTTGAKLGAGIEWELPNQSTFRLLVAFTKGRRSMVEGKINYADGSFQNFLGNGSNLSTGITYSVPFATIAQWVHSSGKKYPVASPRFPYVQPKKEVAPEESY
jgi:hypothetical protein